MWGREVKKRKLDMVSHRIICHIVTGQEKRLTKIEKWKKRAKKTKGRKEKERWRDPQLTENTGAKE